jgi:hypothetical protein
MIENNVIKHRKSLTEKDLKQLQSSFKSINKGSEILFQVLEDPQTELPALE